MKMRDLILTDFKRILKDKLCMVTLILCCAFAVFMPFLYAVLFNAVDTESMAAVFAALGFTINSKTLFFQGFSLGNEVALVVIILLLIIMGRDFSYGTMRNKIIAGKNRSEIFLSMFITMTVSIFAFVLIHSLLTLAVSLIFFEYQEEAFIFSDLLYALLSVFIELMIFVFIGALLSFLLVLTKSAGLSMLLYLAVYIFFSIIGAIAMVAGHTLSLTSNVSEFWIRLVEILLDYNIFTTTLIGTGRNYDTTFAIGIISLMLALSALLLFLGVRVFKKKDLK